MDLERTKGKYTMARTINKMLLFNRKNVDFEEPYPLLY